jgi:hypothetical protein
MIMNCCRGQKKRNREGGLRVDDFVNDDGIESREQRGNWGEEEGA